MTKRKTKTTSASTAISKTTTSAAPIPASLVEAAELVRKYAANSDSKNTVRAYRSDLAHFLSWLERHGLSFPVSGETLALYVSAHAELAPSTLQRRISAIARAHRDAGHDSPNDAPGFRGFWRGFKRTQAESGKTVHGDGSKPITAPELRAMLGTLDRETATGLRDAAILLLGFHGAFRRSELVALNLEDLEETRDGLRITLRRSKTDQDGAGIIKGLMRQADADICPVTAFNEWIGRAAITSGPVFLRIRRGDNLTTARLSDKSVDNVVKKAAQAANLKDADGFSAHSLRSGLATQAAEDGASERAIMAQGGWKSTATVRNYIRPATAFIDNVGKNLRLSL